MYHRFYGLREGPFALTPDPKYLFLSEAHKEALAAMTYGVQERKGFVLILGEVGTGKTTLLRHRLGQFGPEIKAVYLFNSTVTFEELLAAMLRELELSCPGRSGADMIDTLNDYLLKEATAGRYVVLIIDEAQHLSPAVLEHIRMLSNLETARSKLLQIILVGQPELGKRLGHPGLRQLRQRIGLVVELKPLTFDETAEYVGHRLAVAGQRQRLFTKSALRKIYHASGGIPRLINVICDQALLSGYGARAKHINAGIVKEVVKDWAAFGQDAVAWPLPSGRQLAGRRSWLRSSYGPIAAAALLTLSGGWLYLASSEQERAILHRVSRMFGGAGPVSIAASAQDTPSTDQELLGPTAPVPERAAETAQQSAYELDPLEVSPARSSRAPEPNPALASPGTDAAPEALIKPGDTLFRLVSRAYGRIDYTLLDVVQMVNPGIQDINLIRVGQRVRFPSLHPGSRVQKLGQSLYVLHVRTLPITAKSETEQLRAALRQMGREVYVVPVRLTHQQQAHRVLVGDFQDPTQAETFYRALRTSTGVIPIPTE